MLENPVLFGLAGGHLILSNLLTWALGLHQASRPFNTRTILTHLTGSLLAAYNRHTSLVSLCLLLRCGLGPVPFQNLPDAVTAAIFLTSFTFFSLVGLHLALALVRYLTVTHFAWVQPQDYRRLGRRIQLLVAAAAVVLSGLAVLMRPPVGQVADFTSFLSGRPGQKANKHIWPLVSGMTALLLLANIYLASKWILQKRAAGRVQPATDLGQGQGHIRSLTRFIDVKTVVFGCFYPLACYCLAAMVDCVPGLPPGVPITVAVITVNNGVLLLFVTRPGVAAFCWSKIKQKVTSGTQACQEYGPSACRGFLPGIGQTQPRHPPISGQPTVFTVFPHVVYTSSYSVQIIIPSNTSQQPTYGSYCFTNTSNP
jgi:hypothetical protein